VVGGRRGENIFSDGGCRIVVFFGGFSIFFEGFRIAEKK
jgi:hypothetical protein